MEQRGEGRRLPLTVFAMHVSAGGGWGGSGGRRGGAVQDSGCLSDCLTGKLHPSYLSENRGIDRSENKLPPPKMDTEVKGNRQRKTPEIPMAESDSCRLPEAARTRQVLERMLAFPSRRQINLKVK